VARVVCDVVAIRKAFDYLVPEALASRVAVGTEVRVVLQGRRVRGWVTALGVTPPGDVTLHEITAVRGWGPPPAVLELATWAAWRWAGPLPAFLGTASAPTLVRSLPERGRPGVARAAAGANGAAGGPSGVGEVTDDALGGGTTVVRVAPGLDATELALAAGRRVGTGPPGAGVLVLAASQRGAAVVAARLARAGLPVALLPRDWAAARAGAVVAVGTRAGAFAPLPVLSAAVVLDAHDGVYQEERAPTWNAWQVVAERARRDGAPCALVSPCPTLDLLDAGPLVTTSRRSERLGWPALEIVDRRSEDPRAGLFSEALVSLLRWGAADEGRRIVCVLNRTGRVRLSACAACGELARCERCRGALEVLHEQDAPDRLHCRRCGLERPVVCGHCGGTRRKALRLGVSRVREELEALTRVPVVEVAGAPAGRDDAAGTARLVVGTEAALHRVQRADAVAFLDFDAELSAPRIRAHEEAMALLARAARLVAASAPGPGPAGRAPGRILVQTRQPDHEVLVGALGADPARLAESEAPIRRSLGLPPYGALAVLSGAAADVYAQALDAGAPAEVRVAAVGDGSWTLRAPSVAALCDLLSATPRPPGRLRVAVDPLRA